MSDALNQQLLVRLDELSTRYDALTMEMSDPATASNSARIVRLAKEHHNLGRLVEPYRVYRDLLKQLDETRTMANDTSSDAELRAMAAEELPQLEIRVAGLMEELIAGLLAGEDANVDSIIMEIRAGTGGDEAAIFAGDLYDMYSRFAAGHGLKVELIDASPGDHGGYREVIFSVKGAGVYTHLGYEGGGHRVQRVPLTETQGRIHTSAATVAVLPEVEETEFEIDWDKDVLEHVSAAGGPGGQNVNKVASAIKLEHIATGITVSMRDERSQHKNRAKARRLMISRVKQHYDEVERAKRDSTRKSMIGSGDRSERIRTYNFPQNRCTDHRANESYSLEKIVNGELDELIKALRRLDHPQRLVAVATQS